MSYPFSRIFTVLTLSALLLPHAARAQSSCEANVREIESGIIEIQLGEVSVKIESRNKLVKMKINEAFETHSWGWVSTEKGTAKIDGVIEKNGARAFVSQLVASKSSDSNINWGIFKSDNPFSRDSSGTAYFGIKGAVYCVRSTLKGWQKSVEKVMGPSFTEKTTVQAVYAEDAYKRLGLG